MGRRKTGKTLNCFFCSKAKYYPISRIRYSRQFCDETCHGLYVKEQGLQKRENNNCWKNGKTTDNKGYVRLRLPDHVDALSNGYIREHRYIMAKKLGRRLKPNEDVHHIDGNKKNNDPKNLAVVKHDEHTKLHRRNKNEKNTKNKRIF